MSAIFDRRFLRVELIQSPKRTSSDEWDRRVLGEDREFLQPFLVHWGQGFETGLDDSINGQCPGSLFGDFRR